MEKQYWRVTLSLILILTLSLCVANIRKGCVDSRVINTEKNRNAVKTLSYVLSKYTASTGLPPSRLADLLDKQNSLDWGMEWTTDEYHRPLVYRYCTDANTIIIGSYGKDGKVGGKGEDKDVFLLGRISHSGEVCRIQWAECLGVEAYPPRIAPSTNRPGDESSKPIETTVKGHG